jgi:hypothetical protein
MEYGEKIAAGTVIEPVARVVGAFLVTCRHATQETGEDLANAGLASDMGIKTSVAARQLAFNPAASCRPSAFPPMRPLALHEMHFRPAGQL